MEKFKKFCKKPLAFIALGVLSMFIIGFIIMSCVPYAEGSYKYTSKDLSIEIEVDEDEVTVTSDIDGQLHIEEYDAYIKNGKIYVKLDRTSTTYTELGAIDSYKLDMKKQLVNPGAGANETIKLECKLTNVLRIVNIVMISVSALTLIGSAVLMICTKNEDSQVSK